MEDVSFICLCCFGNYAKKKHDCVSLGCVPKEKGVEHYDFCQKCRDIILNNFELQMRRKRGD